MKIEIKVRTDVDDINYWNIDLVNQKDTYINWKRLITKWNIDPNFSISRDILTKDDVVVKENIEK